MEITYKSVVAPSRRSHINDLRLEELVSESYGYINCTFPSLSTCAEQSVGNVTRFTWISTGERRKHFESVNFVEDYWHMRQPCSGLLAALRVIGYEAGFAITRTSVLFTSRLCQVVMLLCISLRVVFQRRLPCTEGDCGENGRSNSDEIESTSSGFWFPPPSFVDSSCVIGCNARD